MQGENSSVSSSPVSSALKVPLRSEARKWSVEKKTTLLLGLASAILLTLNILFFLNFIKQKETTERVGKNWIILQKIEKFFPPSRMLKQVNGVTYSAEKSFTWNPMTQQLRQLDRKL